MVVVAWWLVAGGWWLVALAHWLKPRSLRFQIARLKRVGVAQLLLTLSSSLLALQLPVGLACLVKLNLLVEVTAIQP